MKIKIKSKKIFKSPMYTMASRFERYELFVGLAGVCVVFLMAGVIFYFVVSSGLKSEINVSIKEVKIDKGLLGEVLVGLEAKNKIPKESVIIDPFQ